MKIQATAASTFKDYENGWSYTESALCDLAKSAGGVSVIHLHTKIGVVESGRCDGGKLTIVAKIDRASGIEDRTLYLVPGGLTDFETNGDMLQLCTAHRYTFTEQPSDRTLTAYEVIESETKAIDQDLT